MSLWEKATFFHIFLESRDGLKARLSNIHAKDRNFVFKSVKPRTIVGAIIQELTAAAQGALKSDHMGSMTCFRGHHKTIEEAAAPSWGSVKQAIKCWGYPYKAAIIREMGMRGKAFSIESIVACPCGAAFLSIVGWA